MQFLTKTYREQENDVCFSNKPKQNLVDFFE